MARRKQRQEKPAESNRGRRDARGVFVIFEPDEAVEEHEDEAPADADEPLARDGNGDDDA